MRRKAKLVRGVGINDADYVVERVNKETGKKIFCPFYLRWSGMIERCYSKAYHAERPSYEGCSVCPEWLTFSNFKTWMEQQDWEGKQLDKDLLIEGNKIYSPSSCVFVERLLNSFVTSSKVGQFLGVRVNKKSGKISALCNNPLTKKRDSLGVFESELEAHLAWRSRKCEIVDDLLQEGYIEDERVYKALKLRYG